MAYSPGLAPPKDHVSGEADFAPRHHSFISAETIMKLQTLFLLAAAAVPVWASAAASGWEAVLFYDVYRMDGYRPESERIIGGTCKGTAPGGRCNFIEFIKNIDSMNLYAKATEDGAVEKITRLNEQSIPGDLDRNDPDPAQAAKIGEWEGRPNFDDPGARYKNYDGSYWPLKLVGTDAKLKHADVLVKLGEVVEAAKPYADKAGQGDNLVTRINRVLDQIILARTAENHGNLIREINEHKTLGLPVHNAAIGEPKIVAQPKTITDAQGDTYDSLDSERLFQDIQNHPGANDKKKGKIMTAMVKFVLKEGYFSDTKFSETPKSSGKTHQDTITGVQAVSSKVKSMCPK
ncbi:hypothetical protein CC86DRAFT_382373 [Ophiobolus disseminans]|uniref:Uncharacterized protein n=1 Tax=Ophiobolus disseminans TaxID=1469910 RepID=A0A6A6ZZ30_9PLEO|nr:hypothetical protein CC86DRAFT_382373 [Ophiobolus disseminans]